jgi:hypothetical protein
MAKGQYERAFRREDIEAALARAAEGARQLAAETGVPFLASEGGRAVEERRNGEALPKAAPVRNAG